MAERMNWDHRADHDLLTAMMQELQPSQEQLRGVMTNMHGFGYTCTVKAITYCLLILPQFPLRFLNYFIQIGPTNILLLICSQHLQKLRRKDDKNGGVGNGEGGSGANTPKTPAGRKKNATAGSAKKEPGSGTKRKPVDLSDDEEDVKPLKAAKAPKTKKKEADVKEEAEVKEEEKEEA